MGEVTFPLAVDSSFHDKGAHVGPVRWTSDSSNSTIDCAAQIDQGGWSLVRHVPPGDVWYKATDQLAGTDEYGTPSGPTSEDEFAVKFDNVKFTEFLLATGDCKEWLIADKAQVTGGHYTNATRLMKEWLTFGDQYPQEGHSDARWYRRQGYKQDPLIAASMPEAKANRLLYAENRDTTHAG